MDFIRSCDLMGDAVADAIRELVGTKEGDRVIGMGADGTPTKLIDQVAEDCIVAFLAEHPLCHTLISEELGKKEMSGDAGTIFLDPVDGTYNAVNGIPFYALSIAYAEAGKVEKAYVRDLANNETFTAIRGRGAQLSGHPLRVSQTGNLDESAMSIYGRKFDPKRVMQLGQKIRRWRLLGASALELSYIGAGRIDGFIDLRGTLRVTDAAAGMLICTEAGGQVTDLNADAINFPDEVKIGRCMVATNGVLHYKVIEYLRS
jgi:myo-inositol-1(or 4)-monophosphatase